jgi:uncharacterized protein with HEPN domain
MSKKDWHFFLEDIIEAIGFIDEYVKGMEFEDFKKDRKTIDAVVRNLEIIGEAARHIPESIRAKYPNIEWRGMIGLRNRVIHGYFNIGLEIIWHIVKVELSPLKKEIEKVLKIERKYK